MLGKKTKAPIRPTPETQWLVDMLSDLTGKVDHAVALLERIAEKRKETNGGTRPE